MTLDALPFNDFSSGKNGYNVSSKGISAHSVDIMNRAFDSASSPAPGTGSLFDTGLSQQFAKNDPVYGQEQGPIESLMVGNTRTETLMDTAAPQKSYKGPEVNARSLMRDANQTITDGSKVSMAAKLGMDDVKQNMAEFQKDWKQAKAEVYESLKESAAEMDIELGDAVDAFFPDNTASKASAVSYMAGEAAFGAGTFATAGKSAYVGFELSKSDKGLSEDQKEALLQETLNRLQASSAPSDTRSGPGGTAGSIPMDGPKGSEFSWHNLESGDLKEFMEADPDGMDQPEMVALLDTQRDLEMVFDNHDYIVRHYADNNLYEKSEQLVKTGQSKVAQAEFDQATVAVDAEAVVITSMGLQGIEKLNIQEAVSANDTKFDNVYDISSRIAKASETSTTVDEGQLNYDVLAEENRSYIRSQFSV
ncbi:MAG: hypothetical protein ACRBDL_10895 [Alphaproteobacteria bacterium]